MIVIILSLILFLIFTLLGGFHFYWLFGGIWGLKKVIPTKGNEPSTLAIPKLATLIVGIVLVLFGLFYLVNMGITDAQVSTPKAFGKVTKYGSWIIPSIFILRAVGEFKYVGFFKKIKNTEFAKADSNIFSPLCIGIGIIGILIQLMK